MTPKQKTLSEIRDELAFKNACHEDDFMEGFDAGVAEMKKRAEALVEMLEGVMAHHQGHHSLIGQNINRALETYHRAIE